MDKFKVIIVEDVPLELKGTEGIFTKFLRLRLSARQTASRLIGKLLSNSSPTLSCLI